MLFKGAKPLVERLLGIDDDFKFSIRKCTDHPGAFRREGYFHPFAIEAQRVCDIQNPADLLKRYGIECHACLSVVCEGGGILGGGYRPVNQRLLYRPSTRATMPPARSMASAETSRCVTARQVLPPTAPTSSPS